MTFFEKACRNSGHRKPIREAVRERLPDIVEALDAGASMSGIFRTLKAEGCKVGAGPSSFRNALAALQGEIDELRASKATPGAEHAEATSDVQKGYSDDRFQMDWG